RLPAGGGEVDARRARGGIAVFQLFEFIAAASGIVDARGRLAGAGRRLAPQPLRLPANLIRDRLLSPRLGFEKFLAMFDELVIRPGDAKRPAWVDAAHLDHLVGDRAHEGPIMRR